MPGIQVSSMPQAKTAERSERSAATRSNPRNRRRFMATLTILPSAGRGKTLDEDLQAVAGALPGGAPLAGGHLGAHVGQDDAPGVQPIRVVAEGREVEMEAEPALEGVCLADEEIRSAGRLEQGVRPLRG